MKIVEAVQVSLVYILLFCGAVFADNLEFHRIVSLGPMITEELYLLSSQDRLVGCTAYCERPEAARLKERVGNVQEINIEKIVALKPDVIFATALTDPKAKDKLRSLGLRIVDVPNASNFEEICQNFMELGRTVGKEELAAEIVADARERLEALSRRVSGVRKQNIFVQVGSNPLVTIGQGSFANDFIQFAGGVNIVQQSGYLHYSLEQVLVSDPDVIFISSMGFDGEKEKKNWGKFTSLKAVRDHRVFVVDQNLLCSPTPASFVDLLKIIIDHLHPEIIQ